MKQYTTMSTNPIRDFYLMAYSAGVLKRPVFKILNMPSQDGKSLTSLRFNGIENVLILAGDTTAQGFRNRLKKLDQKQKVNNIVLIIVEDASKIRRKVREDFFALCTQFATGVINIDQTGLDVGVRSHASVVINTPPFFKNTLESLLLDSGAGGRFDMVKCELSDSEKRKLNELGDVNMPNQLETMILPTIQRNINFEEYSAANSNQEPNMIKCMYACKCAGIDENLVLAMHNNIITRADWSGYWVNQCAPVDDTLKRFLRKEKQEEDELKSRGKL